MNKEDAAIFAALKEGDKVALSTLFNSYYDQLFHYGQRIAHSDAIVEEAIQELFVYLFEAGERLGDVVNVKGYLFTAIRRRVLEKLHAEQQRMISRNHLREQPDIQFSIEDILINKEDETVVRQQLTRALNELPPRQREAIYLRYYNNLSTKEIALIMGISSQTVLNTLHQALRKLYKKECLKRLIRLLSPVLILIGFHLLR